MKTKTTKENIEFFQHELYLKTQEKEKKLQEKRIKDLLRKRKRSEEDYEVKKRICLFLEEHPSETFTVYQIKNLLDLKKRYTTIRDLLNSIVESTDNIYEFNLNKKSIQ